MTGTATPRVRRCFRRLNAGELIVAVVLLIVAGWWGVPKIVDAFRPHTLQVDLANTNWDLVSVTENGTDLALPQVAIHWSFQGRATTLPDDVCSPSNADWQQRNDGVELDNIVNGIIACGYTNDTAVQSNSRNALSEALRGFGAGGFVPVTGAADSLIVHNNGYQLQFTRSSRPPGS
ncbi:MAG: hypothetical protein ACR2P2_05760 [Nakamurella sp.]